MLCMFPSTFLNIWSIFIVSILMSLLANYIISVISDFLLFDFFWLLFIFFYFFVCLVIFDYMPNVIFTVWSARYFLFILLNSVEFLLFFFSVMQLSYLESVCSSRGLFISSLEWVQTSPCLRLVYPHYHDGTLLGILTDVHYEVFTLWTVRTQMILSLM